MEVAIMDWLILLWSAIRGALWGPSVMTVLLALALDGITLVLVASSIQSELSSRSVTAALLAFLAVPAAAMTLVAGFRVKRALRGGFLHLFAAMGGIVGAALLAVLGIALLSAVWG
ncbi:MAG: hypothetical protein ACE5IZ_03945 [Dehalococcoidia bacterium]